MNSQRLAKMPDAIRRPTLSRRVLKMKIVSLEIENFRAIRSAKILLDGHTLLIGANNVGKSTICEALDLVLGADRLNRQSPIDEFDFYNAKYMERQAADEPPKLIEIRIEATLVEF